VPKDRYNRTELLNFRVKHIHRRSVFILFVLIEFLEERAVVYFIRKEVMENLLFENCSAVLPVFRVALNK